MRTALLIMVFAWVGVSLWAEADDHIDVMADAPPEVRDLLREPGPKTFLELLARVPLEYRGNFGGIRSSRSAQTSSDTEPRIIMFSPETTSRTFFAIT